MPLDVTAFGQPPGTEISAIALTPGDHLNLVNGDNWLITPPAAWVAAQGQARLDAIASFQAAGYLVQPDLLYRPRRLGSFNPRLNRAPGSSGLSWGLVRSTDPAMPVLSIYFDAATRSVTHPRESYFYPIKSYEPLSGFWYSLVSLSAPLHANDGATWLASLRKVSADGQTINAACVFYGQTLRLRISLTPFGHLGGEAPVTGYRYSKEGGVEFIHPDQGIAGQIDLPEIDIDLAQSVTSFSGGLGSGGAGYYLDDLDISKAGLALLDQKNHGRTLLLGVLVNHARSEFVAQWVGNNYSETDHRRNCSETAWLRAVIEIALSQDINGAWQASATVLYTPATLEAASNAWTVYYVDNGVPGTITGTGPVAPTPPHTVIPYYTEAIAGEHDISRALTAYYAADGAVVVRRCAYHAESLQDYRTTPDSYQQSERIDISEGATILSSLDSLSEASWCHLLGLSGCEGGLDGEGQASILDWRLKFHDQANTAFTGREWAGSAILEYGGSGWDIYPGPVSSAGGCSCGDHGKKRILEALPETDYPLDVLYGIGQPYTGENRPFIAGHYGGPIYDMWRRGAMAWLSQSNTAQAPALVSAMHILQLAGGDALHADLPLLADVDTPQVDNYLHVLTSRIDHAVALTPLGTLPAATASHDPEHDLGVFSVFVYTADYVLRNMAPWLDYAHARYNRATNGKGVVIT